MVRGGVAGLLATGGICDCTFGCGIGGTGNAARAAASASSTAKVNFGLAPLLLPLVPSLGLISVRWRAAYTQCSARRSCASRCAFNFSASFSGAGAGEAPRGGAAFTPGRGAMGAGLTAAFAAGAAGANSSAMRGISLPAPMPRRSRQLRLSVPLSEFWSIPFARSYISSTGLTPRMLSPLARE